MENFSARGGQIQEAVTFASCGQTETIRWVVSSLILKVCKSMICSLPTCVDQYRLSGKQNSHPQARTLLASCTRSTPSIRIFSTPSRTIFICSFRRAKNYCPFSPKRVRHIPDLRARESVRGFQRGQCRLVHYVFWPSLLPFIPRPHLN